MQLFKVGDMVGELRVEKELPERKDGGVVWRCRCTCGLAQKRTTGNLNRSIRKGTKPACRRCCGKYLVNRERGKEERKRRRSSREAALKNLWSGYKTLYTDLWHLKMKDYLLAHMAEDITTLRTPTLNELLRPQLLNTSDMVEELTELSLGGGGPTFTAAEGTLAEENNHAPHNWR